MGVVCLFSGAMMAHAQDSTTAPAAEHMTLKEVAQKVVLNNPEVLVKFHAFKASIGDVSVAEAGYYPKLDLNSGVAREQIKRAGIVDNDYTRSSHTLSLSQVLYDGYATGNDIKRVDKTRLVRYYELVDTAEAAALEASRVYFDVMRFRMMVFLAENNFIEHRASYEQLLRRSQAGAGKRVDVEHAAGRLALAELNLNTEAANLHDVMSRYLRLVGEPPPTVMFAPGLLNRGFPTEEADALELALKHNPTLRVAMENVDAAQYELKARRGTLHPRVEFRMSSENSNNLEGIAGRRQDNKVGILLNFNLFNGGADMARQSISVERKNLALDLREKACRDIRQTLSIAYNDVSRLRAQLANLELQVSAVEKTRDAYKAQFNIGQRSLLDLLDTEGELLNARRTSVNADIDLSLSYLRTHAGIGRLLEFLKLKSLSNDDTPDVSELAQIAEGDICPPDAPKNYLVNIEALTARALATLETPKSEAVESAFGAATVVPIAAPSVTTAATAAKPPPTPIAAPRKKLQKAPVGAGDTPSSTVPQASPTQAIPSAEAKPVNPTAAAPSAAESPIIPAPATLSAEAKLVSSTPSVSSGEANKDAVTQRLNAWASAWAAKDFAAYAAFYAPTFVPEKAVSRDAWAAKRAQKIAAAAAIKIELENIRVKEKSSGRTTTTFTQRYHADKFSDDTSKKLTWKNVDGSWLITREQQWAKSAAREASEGAKP